MRAIVLFIASSLDGFIAKSDGGVEWLFTDDNYGYEEFFASVDTVIMGRKTYAQILGFGAYPYGGTQGFVLTRKPVFENDENVTFMSENIPDLIDSLRQSPGKNIWLVGGAEIIQLFVQHNWIDRIILAIHPVILGGGIPLFLPTEAHPQWWNLQGLKTFASGLVQLSYVRANF
jgi:dihydrofolate reductase